MCLGVSANALAARAEGKEGDEHYRNCRHKHYEGDDPLRESKLTPALQDTDAVLNNNRPVISGLS